MKQVFGPKVEVSLTKSYHSADASKSKILIFKGVSNNITIKDFQELLDFNPGGHSITKHTGGGGGLARRSESKTSKYLSKNSNI